MKRKYLGYIIPSMLSFLLTGIYSIVDGIFVGRAMGDAGLAAINIAWPLVNLLFSLGTGIGMGAAVMVSLKKGSGKEEAALRMEGNAFTLLLAGSLILIFILYFTGDLLLILMGTEGEIHRYALTYLRYMLFGGVFQVLASGCVPLMRNRGASLYSMIAMTCGCILNIILDYYFILVLQWELMGAAIASVLGQSLTLLFGIAFYLRKSNRIPLTNLKPRLSSVTAILKVAVSPFGLTYLPSVAILLMNLQCLKYGGEEAVSAYAVMAYLVSFVELFVQGISDGSQPLLSLSKGKGDDKSLKSYTRWTFCLTLGLGFLSGAATYLCRNLIPSFYGTSAEAGTLFIRYTAAFSLVMLLYGLTKPAVSYFYATHQLSYSGFLVYGEVAITVITIFMLPLVIGLEGVWLTTPLAQLILGICSIVFLIKGQKNSSNQHS